MHPFTYFRADTDPVIYMTVFRTTPVQDEPPVEPAYCLRALSQGLSVHITHVEEASSGPGQFKQLLLPRFQAW